MDLRREMMWINEKEGYISFDVKKDNQHQFYEYLKFYQPKRSKREDIDEILCPKCKKPMKDRTYLMMGVDKECPDCDQKWHHKFGFNPYR